MTTDYSPLADLLSLAIKEGKRRAVVLTAIFAVVAVAALGVGLSMPKRWDASTVIVAEASNIIKPLLEGGEGRTTLADQTPLVTEAVKSRRILREVLAFGGFTHEKTNPIEEEQQLGRLSSRIRIESPRENTIHIAYHDTDPARAYKITNKLAEIYIRESMALKERESRDAFEFISRRVKEYRDNLTTNHEKLLAYYRGQEIAVSPVVSPSASAERRAGPARPVANVAAGAGLSPDEVAALRAEEATLRAQLAKSAGTAAAPAESRQLEDQARTRVIQLSSELDRLLTTYTEQHPDVRRVQRDLALAKQELRGAEQARTDREKAAAAASALDEEVARATNERLEAVQRKLSAATGARGGGPRPAPVPAAAAATAIETGDPEMRGVGQDTTLSELLRRYEASREVYQDLLERQENARVSMDLVSEHRGLILRIQEPAEMPVVASSMRLLHVSVLGLLVAAAVPIAILFALVRLDPRLRSPRQIERLARVPLLVAIPPARAEAPGWRRRVLVALLVAGVFAIYVAAFVVRVKTTS